MGGGSLIQLIAFGNQNVVITGNPQITFFKSVYRRYTNFSIESIQQDIIGSLKSGSRISVTIGRNGDLLKGITLQYNPSKIIPPQGHQVIVYSANLGHVIFESIDLEIGGNLIDRHYGIWLTIWRDLTRLGVNETQLNVGLNGEEPYASLIYNRTAYTHMNYIYTQADLNSGVENTTINAPTEAYVPLQFWFCRNPGLALPLIALQYHEVKLNINLANKEAILNCYTYDNLQRAYVDLTSIKLYADYIYLDSVERKKFANDSHEYLIEQLQFQNYNDHIVSNNTVSIPLNFQHPIKELVFCGQPQTQPLRTIGGGLGKGPAFPESIIYRQVGLDLNVKNPDITGVKMTLTFNALPRFTPRNLKYFTRNQIWDCHTGSGSYVQSDSIGVYSFALRPEEHQPSGTANFSRITNPRMVFTDFDTNVNERLNDINIYAINYNVLRIMSGMGSIVFAN